MNNINNGINLLIKGMGEESSEEHAEKRKLTTYEIKNKYTGVCSRGMLPTIKIDQQTFCIQDFYCEEDESDEWSRSVWIDHTREQLAVALHRMINNEDI